MAREKGYPSRAVFKLVQANQKHNLLRKNDVVVDLGCSPGSWTKLSSRLVGGRGFVLGLDITDIPSRNQLDMGVRPADLHKPVEAPRSRQTISSDGQDGLLQSERRLLQSTAPVGFLNQDITTWDPPSTFQHHVDAVLSDIAPKTTGIPSADAANSIALCYNVLDLCTKLFKPPTTQIKHLRDDHERSRAVLALQADSGGHDIVTDDLKTEFERRLLKKHKKDTPASIQASSGGKIDLKVLKKTLKQHAYLKKADALGVTDLPQLSAVYKLDERTLAQVRGSKQHTTHWRGVLIMKVFQGEGFTELVDTMKSLFVSTYTFKPDASRRESVELFLIGKGYCGPLDSFDASPADVRRPKTEDYLQKYKSNNRKRAPTPHDPSKNSKFETYTGPQRVSYAPSALSPHYKAGDAGGDGDAPLPPKFDPSMSLDDIYKQLGYDRADVEFTSDSFVHDAEFESFEQYKQMAVDTVRQGIKTNVHTSIRHAAIREEGEMTPLQREISESDDILVYRQQDFDLLYGQESTVNKIPTPADLSKTMSLFWDEGINFAKKMQVTHNTNTKYDVTSKGKDVIHEIGMDPIDALLVDRFTTSSDFYGKMTTSSTAASDSELDHEGSTPTPTDSKPPTPRTTRARGTATAKTKKVKTAVEPQLDASDASAPHHSSTTASAASISGQESTPSTQQTHTPKKRGRPRKVPIEPIEPQGMSDATTTQMLRDTELSPDSQHKS